MYQAGSNLTRRAAALVTQTRLKGPVSVRRLHDSSQLGLRFSGVTCRVDLETTCTVLIKHPVRHQIPQPVCIPNRALIGSPSVAEAPQLCGVMEISSPQGHGHWDLVYATRGLLAGLGIATKDGAKNQTLRRAAVIKNEHLEVLAFAGAPVLEP